jgi:hypothetical protein
MYLFVCSEVDHASKGRNDWLRINTVSSPITKLPLLAGQLYLRLIFPASVGHLVEYERYRRRDKVKSRHVFEVFWATLPDSTITRATKSCGRADNHHTGKEIQNAEIGKHHEHLQRAVSLQVRSYAPCMLRNPGLPSPLRNCPF